MAATYKGVEIPENDAARVEAVLSYQILETAPERQFDDITELAAQILGCPVAYISIFDDTRSWLKSSYGLPPGRPPRPREQSMCAPTICQTDLLVIPDMSKNPRYQNLPAVTNPPHARFYCAMPLINRDTFALGTLCVWSPEIQNIDDEKRDAMRRLARLTVTLMEHRRDLLEMRDAQDGATDKIKRSRAAVERAEKTAYRLLPQAVAVRLLANADVTPRVQKDVTVLCVTFHGSEAVSDLTNLAESWASYVALLDQIVDRHGLEKVGLQGASYIAVSGMPRTNPDHARVAVAAAEDIHAELTKFSDLRSGSLPVWTARIGLDSGTVVSGLTGSNRLEYRVWGQPIDSAGDLSAEDTGPPVNPSEATRALAVARPG